MPQILLQFVLPLAVSAIKSYIQNSSSKQDDQVLNLVQEGVVYLCNKDNNTVGKFATNNLLSAEMVKGVNNAS